MGEKELISETDKTLAYKEVEVKYRADLADLNKFCMLCQNLPNIQEFVFAMGPDYYYTKDDRFVRYRKEMHKGDKGRAELTVKVKPDGAKNNVVREEYNVRVDGTPQGAVEGFIASLGFKLNFIVQKTCYIYRYDDATVVMYTVADVTDNKPKYEYTFIEIEVDEEKLHHMTIEQAWEVIKKYEVALDPLGINAYKRIKKSLFEMYVRE